MDQKPNGTVKVTNTRSDLIEQIYTLKANLEMIGIALITHAVENEVIESMLEDLKEAFLRMPDRVIQIVEPSEAPEKDLTKKSGGGGCGE